MIMCESTSKILLISFLPFCEDNYVQSSTTVVHCADKLPSRGCKQIQINTDSHWIIDFFNRSCLCCTM